MLIPEMKLSRTRKTWLIVGSCLFVLAVCEQTGWLAFSFTHALSASSMDVERAAPWPGDLVSTTNIDRPVARWLPFIKFGQTVTRCVIQEKSATGPTYEKVLTTRVKLWTVGFCSTARYDRMVDEYAVKFRADSTKPK